MENYRVIIVDDEIMFSELLRDSLSSKSLNVVGIAPDGREALKLLEDTAVDIALVDLQMDVMGGAELTRRIKEIHPEMKVLILTAHFDRKNIVEAFLSGADSYILKGSSVQSTITAIENVMSGRAVIDEKVLKLLADIINAGSVESPSYGKFDALTPREREICVYIAKGHYNDQIAAILNMKEGTVKNHISAIYEKTGIHYRPQLAIEFLAFRSTVEGR